jgi:nucleoid-associated protein YgaU
MGKDFRVGLITGVVLAGAALLWVATRPSLSPQARIPRSPQAAGGAEKPPEIPLPWAVAGLPEANEPQTAPQDPRPAQDAALVSQPGPAGSSSTQVPESAHPSPVASSPLPRTEPARPSGAVGTAQNLTIYETSEPIKTTRFHIVRKGETLSSIAQQYYGTANKWQKIVTANAKTVKNANKIAPGTKLIIPD